MSHCRKSSNTRAQSFFSTIKTRSIWCWDFSRFWSSPFNSNKNFSIRSSPFFKNNWKFWATSESTSILFSIISSKNSKIRSTRSTRTLERIHTTNFVRKTEKSAKMKSDVITLTFNSFWRICERVRRSENVRSSGLVCSATSEMVREDPESVSSNSIV